MKIQKETLQQIAKLAHLDLEGEDEQSMISDLNKIIEWMDMLREVDTEEVMPLTHPAFEMNQLREDQAKSTLSREKALELAPKKDETYFKVPKVISEP